MLYYVMPFKHPSVPESMYDDSIVTQRDALTEAITYKKALLTRWPEARFLPAHSPFIRLRWHLIDEGRTFGAGQLAGSTVQFTTQWPTFYVWHRRIIPAEIRLLLYTEHDPRNFELLPTVTEAQVSAFLKEAGSAP